ncbi:MAG: GTP-binding protein [Phycisphaerae bacterium]
MFRTDKPVSRERFDNALDALGDRLLRLKGHVRFEEGLRFVECVGAERAESGSLAESGGSTAFTAITWKTPPIELIERFNACWED